MKINDAIIKETLSFAEKIKITFLKKSLLVYFFINLYNKKAPILGAFIF